MSEGGSKRAVAEIRFSEDRIGITKVGGRSIHQYWSLLSPHFRDVLLAPQRRSDDGGVSWTWRESADKKPLTAAELAGVRQRLGRAKESFEENPVNPLVGEDRSGTSSQVLIDQVAAKVKMLAEGLAGKTDAALAAFVCRTETGVMVHSWGVASAAQIVYPDSLETGVSGVVQVGGKAAEGYEVVIENSKGLSVARMQSDEAGEFHFSKIGPGRYRVHVVSGKVRFPGKGTMVTVERGLVTRLELRSTDDPENPGEIRAGDSGPASPGALPAALNSKTLQKSGGRGRFVKTLGIVLLLLLLVGGGVWAWRKWSTLDEANTRVVATSSSMTPEKFPSGEQGANTPQSSGLAADDAGTLGASADGVGSAGRRPVSNANSAPHRRTVATTTGGSRSPSTIGSKVEVLSDAAEMRSSEMTGAGDLAEPAAIEAENVRPGTFPEQTDAGSTAVGATGTSAATHKKSAAARAAGPSLLGVTPQKGGEAAVAEDAVAVDGTNLLPGVKKDEGTFKIPAAKKATLGPVSGAVSGGETPTAGEAAKDEVATIGSTPSTATPEDVIVGKPETGLPEAKAPTVKVAVVNKGAPDGKLPPDSAAAKDDDTAASAGRDAPAPDAARTKRGKGAPGAGNKVAAGASTASGDVPAAMPSAQNATAATASVAGENPVGPNHTTPAKSAVSATDAGSAEADKALDDQAKKSGSAKTQNRGKKTGSQALASRTQSAPQNKTTTSSQNVMQDEVPGDDTPAVANEDSSVKQQRRENPPTAFKASSTTVTVAVRMAAVGARLVRDAIVATMPVRIGDEDTSETLRKKMIIDQKARLPEAFKRASMRNGLAFELPVVTTAGSYAWRAAVDLLSVKEIVHGNRAEISWDGGMPPKDMTCVLSSPDGHEVVRLIVNQSGLVLLTVAEGVRCSLSLSVPWIGADEPNQKTEGETSRFAWFINGVEHASAQKHEQPAPENRNHHIDLPLKLSEGGRMNIALTDRITGWALVTSVQLQPKE